MKTILVPSIILSVGISLCGYFVAQSIVYFKNANNIVDVRGLDERLVKANEGYLDMRISMSSNNLQELSQELEQKQTVMRTFLTEQGFKAEELQTIPTTITDNSTFAQTTPNTPPPPHYTARGGIVAASYNVDTVQRAHQHSSSLISKGIILESAYAKYLFTNLATLKQEMLKSATNNARESAQTFAQDAHVHLGKMKSASQGLFTITAPNSDYDDETSMNKKVRVVVKATYQLE